MNHRSHVTPATIDTARGALEGQAFAATIAAGTTPALALMARLQVNGEGESEAYTAAFVRELEKTLAR